MHRMTYGPNGPHEDTRPHVLIAFLTEGNRDGWVNPNLVIGLLKWAASDEYRVSVSKIFARWPIAVARNVAVQKMQEQGADWLLMLDNDVVPPPNALHALDLADARHDIIALPYPVIGADGLPEWPIGWIEPPPEKPEDRLYEVAWSVLGCGFVNRRVFEKLSRPYFRHPPRLGEEEIGGCLGEDGPFCEDARAAGFHIYVHYAITCEHLHLCGLRFFLNAIEAARRQGPIAGKQ